MKQVMTLVCVTLIGINTFALVGGVNAIDEGENRISLEAQTEGGKIEPNENKASYQDANIKINRLKYTYGLGDFFKLSTDSLTKWINEPGQFLLNDAYCN